ncbi:hypothetical protein DRJ16_06910 [Candidatus Woesearchaeota archaeon]|nr:MAG: hypothetical protein DRJ16_06910 [Candidatus Woesearchaeota archaeon]
MNKDRIPLSEVIATLKPIVANIAENYSFPSFIIRKISSENFDILIITWRDKLGYLQVDYLFALRPRYDASFTRVVVIKDELFVPYEYPLKQKHASELINLIKRLPHLIMLNEL